jgi:5-methylcytosine-specific restriction endonuclease McrA
MHKLLKSSPEKLQKERERYQQKKEHIAQLTADYRSANREALRLKAIEYRKAKAEQIKAARRLQYLAKKEQINKKSAEYYQQNKEKMLTANKTWCSENKERVRAIKVNRDRRMASGKLSTNIVSKLMRLQRGCCACCGLSLSNGYHLDHIMPIAKGGQNSDDNVQLLTPTCNLKKKDLDPIVWAQKNGRLL